MIELVKKLLHVYTSNRNMHMYLSREPRVPDIPGEKKKYARR
jgi:hypothetical protein